MQKTNLEILHWVPIMFHEDQSVGRRQIQAQTTDCNKQESSKQAFLAYQGVKTTLHKEFLEPTMGR